MSSGARALIAPSRDGAVHPAPVRRARSIAWPIFALVIVSVIAATGILFFVMFSGPPPMHRPRGLEEVAAALAGKPAPPPPWAVRRPSGPADAERPLRVSIEAATPVAGWREQPDAETAARLATLVGRPARDLVAFTELGTRPFGGELFGQYTVALRMPAGWRVVRNPAMPLFTRWHRRTLTAMLIAILALSIPAWGLSRAITRSLRELAHAAGRARAGAGRPDFPAGGAGEVRALTAAVSAMHDRLAGQAEMRTAMLGAIAHDLGTPLTRLAFWVEQLPDPARDRAVADIAEMRGMIADTLRFARDEAMPREATLVDLGSLLDSLVEDSRVGGAAVTIVAGPRAVVRGDPGGLRRIFANLIGNALRYGGAAEVAWTVAFGQVRVTVRDRGPGVDPAQVERLFAPFVRGDPSRNRATGGSGLGLAIVRAITEHHDGTATLANRADAPGAEASVTLPLAR